MRNRQAVDGQSIHQREIGRRRDLPEGTGHGQVRRAQDVQRIDFLDGSAGDADPRVGAGREQGVKKLPARSGEFFGVVDAGEGARGFRLEKIPVEDDGGGDHGAGERAAAGLIHAGDAKGSGAPRFLLEAEQGAVPVRPGLL